jgi:nucleoside-diphosphate-sugar epimerase
MTTTLSPLHVLFIGGTGTISASCVREAAAQGMNVTVLNRGNNQRARSLPEQVNWITGDITDPTSVTAAIEGLSFDSVVNFLSYNAEDAQRAVDIFTGRTRQYVQISTASMYHKPIGQVPVVESTLRANPFLRYARDKIAAEEVLMKAHIDDGFPTTIVRPSHTYDEANPPMAGGWEIFNRVERGDEIVVHGDGTSLWTLTHAADFAVGLVGLLVNPRAIGEDFHITSDDVYTWDQIYTMVGDALGVEAKLVHVPTEFFLVAAPEWGWSELFAGDLAHSAIFDNSKIRRFVPSFSPTRTFVRAVVDMARWRGEHPHEAIGEAGVGPILDRMVDGYHQSRKVFESLRP